MRRGFPLSKLRAMLSRWITERAQAHRQVTYWTFRKSKCTRAVLAFPGGKRYSWRAA